MKNDGTFANYLFLNIFNREFGNRYIEKNIKNSN